MIRRLVIHPFLLGIYPILALYANNVYEARPEDLIAPIIAMLGLTTILLALGYLVLRDWRKSGLLVSVLIVVFFSVARSVDFINHLIIEISSLWVVSYARVSALQVFLVCGAILSLACYYVARRMKDSAAVTAVLNAFALVLVALPVANAFVARAPTQFGDHTVRKPEPLAPLVGRDPLPDIYYIVLDSYARGDVMKALFDFDNRPFLESLERKGFYIAKHSTANYCQTRLCLSCSLNGDYLDKMVSKMGKDQTDLAGLIGQNDVMASLRPLGYRFVNFSSGFSETDHPEADVYLSPNPILFSGFHRLLMTTTPFGTLLPGPRVLDRFETIRERVPYTLDHLPDIADDPASTFTFAHFMCPHPPFLFGANGEDISKRDDRYYQTRGLKFDGVSTEKVAYYRGYRDQAMFITKRIEETIDRILAKSKTPPIIILQSDHGSGMNLDMGSLQGTDLPERMTILNAYYFPDKRFEGLYDTISPVNSFRVVFNTFFGAKLNLLADKSYYSTWGEPYDFYDVTSQVVRRDYPGDPPAPRDPPAVAPKSKSLSGSK